MKQSEKLSVVVRLSLDAEKRALNALAEAQAKLQAEEQKLTELAEYLKGYQDKLCRMASNSAFSIGQRDNYHLFMQQLSTAMEQQQHVIVASQQNCEKLSHQWRLAKQKHQGMLDYVGRLERQEAAEESKREQKMLDDLNCLKYQSH